jgi:hypothetical protein
MSPTDFSRLKAEAVLMDDAVPEYERRMDFFYLDQLAPLNASIYVMERILHFPVWLFTEPGHAIFLPLVLSNFSQAVLLTITRLATDRGGDLFTLLRFKNWVHGNVRPEYRTEFGQYLRRTRFDEETKALFRKARQVRDSQIAHIKADVPFSEEDLLAFEELKALRDSLNSILGVLSFGTGRMMLSVPYSPEVIHPEGTDTRSDIEKILDGIARDSVILNLPETQPHHWAVFRDNLSEQDIRVLNGFRARFNLPEV